MANWKINLFFAGLNQGWSETYYKVANTGAAVYTSVVQSLLPKRMACLAVPYQCTAGRISDDQVQRDSILWKPIGYSRFDGSYPGDTPWQAYNLRLAAGMSHWRQLYVRGVPDVAFTFPETAVPQGQNSWFLALVAFRNEMISGGWSLKVKSKTGAAPKLGVKALTRTTAAIMMTETYLDHQLNPGDFVQFYNFKNVVVKPGVRQVTSTPSPQQFLVNYALPDPWIGSPLVSVKKVVYEYPLIDDYSERGWTHRIVGRPFGQQRGRRSVART